MTNKNKSTHSQVGSDDAADPGTKEKAVDASHAAAQEAKSTTTIKSQTHAKEMENNEKDPANNNNDDGDNTTTDNNNNNNDSNEEEKEDGVVLFKSSRLKAYLTLFVSSLINYDSAQKSSDTSGRTVAIPATDTQRKYAVAVAVVSLVISIFVVLVHVDRFTPLEKFWITAFQPKSRIELSVAVFLIVWWSVGVGVQTSIRGIAGDGKEQYNLYYSAWVCCWTSYWILERWFVAAGYSSLKSFITSWPYRAPGWICILFLSIFTLIWYMDLWKSHGDLGGGRPGEIILYQYFARIPETQWRLLVSLIVFTIAPAAVFVLAEIVRETKPGGSEKNRFENIAEGLCLLILLLLWIPFIVIATTPGGAASLVGNAYFSSWLLVVFIAETGVWFVHDQRARMENLLRARAVEYKQKQKEVLQNTLAIQKRKRREQRAAAGDSNSSTRYDDEDNNSEEGEERFSTVDSEYFDAVEDI